MSAPSAPPITIRPRPYLNSIQFWWGQPTSAGGGGDYISSYYFRQFNTPDTLFNTAVGPSSFTTVLSNLPALSSYQFGITAINQNGISSPYVLYRNVQTGLRPGAPSTCQAIPQSTTIVLVNFQQPDPPVADQASIKWFVTTTQYLDSTIAVAKFGSHGTETSRWFTGLSNEAPVKFLVNCVNDPGYSLPTQTNWLYYPYAFAQPSELIVWMDMARFNYNSVFYASTLSNYATNGGYTIEAFDGYGPGTIFYGSPGTGLNNLPIIRFDTTQAMAVNPPVNNPQTYTLFTVARQLNMTNGRVFGSRTNNSLYGYWNGNKNVFFIEGNPSYLSGNPSDDIWDIYSYTRTASNTDTLTSWYWNGSTIVEDVVNTNSIADLTLNGYVIGSVELSDCEIAEVILYTSSFGTDDRQKIEGYLAYKWGLQSNLPSNHPYKYTQP